jgi:hypothetical protein
MLEHRDPLTSSKLGQRATTPAVPSSSGEPILHHSSSSIDRPPSPPSPPVLQDCATVAEAHRSAAALEEMSSRFPIHHLIGARPLGEPHRHPACLATSPHRPHAHVADHAAREPLASPGRPHHCAAACVATTRRASGWKDSPILCDDFLIFNFCLIFQKIHINFKNT